MMLVFMYDIRSLKLMQFIAFTSSPTIFSKKQHIFQFLSPGSH